MATREAQIDALIRHAENDFPKIKKKYESSLNQQVIDIELQIDIKGFCEHLRSCLDYLAHDIREVHSMPPSPKDRFYFPILPTKADFIGRMKGWYPGLDNACPDLWNYLESVQPYNGKIWLAQFNELNNTNKHSSLVAQTRSEWKQTTVTSNHGTVSWGPGVTFGGGVSIFGVPVNPATQRPVPHPSQKVGIVTWVDFRFDGIDVSALALLKEALDGVTRIVSDCRKWL